MLTSNFENVNIHDVVNTSWISDFCLIFMAYSQVQTKNCEKEEFLKIFLKDIKKAPWSKYSVNNDYINNKVTISENIHNEIIDKDAPRTRLRVTHPAYP